MDILLHEIGKDLGLDELIGLIESLWWVLHLFNFVTILKDIFPKRLLYISYLILWPCMSRYK